MKDWGICDRCKKQATCGRYAIDVGSDDMEVEVCEPCFFDLKEVKGRWFRQPADGKAVREAEDRKAYLDYLARTGGKSSCP